MTAKVLATLSLVAVLGCSAPAFAAGSVEAGQAKSLTCMACHGADGKGMHAVGAPNLTDAVWLYGGDADTIRETVIKGRMGQMPAFADKLGEQRVRLLAAYVLRMSGSDQ